MTVKRLILLLPVLTALVGVSACKDTTGSGQELRTRARLHDETSADSTKRGPGLFGGGS
jgi:hypothetical protein